MLHIVSRFINEQAYFLENKVKKIRQLKAGGWKQKRKPQNR
jgi:hypothetical protein